MSPAVSLTALKKVKERGLPVIFTCHIPGIICQRGTLLRYGREVCDGLWGLEKCTVCSLQGHGLPVPFATLLSGIPPQAGRGLAACGFGGPVVTALRMRELMARRQGALGEFFDGADRVIAVSSWLRDMLIANGLDRDKVILCRHGFSQQSNTPSGTDQQDRTSRINGSLKLAFLGRLNPTKGAHVLVEAIRRRPQMRVELDIFGIVQDDLAYLDRLRNSIGNDPRLHLRAPLPNEAVVEKLREYDALAVPSQWMETGPLVVYDAFVAGIPVIGSRRGGLMELVTHGRDGLLVEPADPEAWADCLQRLTSDVELQKQLRAGVQPPRSMSEVASEMLEVYNEVSSKMMAVHHG
jgi:glycosyltransferase involved in cell wall biosynthesis